MKPGDRVRFKDAPGIPDLVGTEGYIWRMGSTPDPYFLVVPDHPDYDGVYRAEDELEAL